MSKLKYVACALLLVCLVGACTQPRPAVVGTATSGKLKFWVICLDGVEYLTLGQSKDAYLSPHFKRDGSLYTCADYGNYGTRLYE